MKYLYWLGAIYVLFYASLLFLATFFNDREEDIDREALHDERETQPGGGRE